MKTSRQRYIAYWFDQGRADALSDYPHRIVSPGDKASIKQTAYNSGYKIGLDERNSK